MENIEKALSFAVRGFSDQNYAQSLTFYRFWFDIGQKYYRTLQDGSAIGSAWGVINKYIPSDQAINAIWNSKETHLIVPGEGKLIHPTAHLIVRFANDAESDRLLAPHNAGLQTRLCTKALREFFSDNLKVMIDNTGGAHDRVLVEGRFCAITNLIAHCANLGYLEEAAIRNHVLQSLISYPKLYDHQAQALIVLFKLAGATFGAYVDQSVVDRCFELLKEHSSYNPRDMYKSTSVFGSHSSPREDSYDVVKKRLIQEVIVLRERGWAGLPPPPVFKAGKSKQLVANQKDPTTTLITAPLRPLNRDLDPQTPQSLLLKSVTIPEQNTTPEPPVSPLARSPSITVATLPNFTIADTSDDEPPVGPTAQGTSVDEPPVDLAVTARHETFYLEDGNVEVLCENTLFRVHVSTLSFHSPALRQTFAQASLATAESPNGCPRILSSDTATDFATLLKMIYLPGFSERNKVPDFATFSSLLRITAKYEMPTVRSQLLEVIHDTYPETFEGPTPSTPLGESIFSGPNPHPNEVLNLFVQQKLTSALPMAYYMAARRGPKSLMGNHKSRNAMLAPKVLQSAITGLMALREVELNETHRLIFESEGSHPCSESNCPSRTPTSPTTLKAYRKVFDYVVGSSRLGMKVLQVPEFYKGRGHDFRCVSPNICSSCAKRWEAGHAELRKKVWVALPHVFGLKG